MITETEIDYGPLTALTGTEEGNKGVGIYGKVFEHADNNNDCCALK